MTTRTPTQVASHAQKYFIRQLSGGKDKRRSSIHDITIVNLAEKKSPSPDDDRPPTTDKSSPVMQPPTNSKMNGISKAFYNYNLPNQEATMAFNLSNSSVISTSHQVTSYEQKPRDRNTYGITLHGFQFGDYNTTFQM